MMKKLSLILLLAFSACRPWTRSASYIDEYLSGYQDVIGKTIRFKDLRLANGHRPSASARFKILTVVGADCGSCVQMLKDWDRYLKNESFKDTEVVFVAVGNNENFFDDYLKSEQISGFAVYLNPSQSFLQDNNIGTYYQKHLLLDKNNKVIMVGDPMESPVIKSYYDEKINSL